MTTRTNSKAQATTTSRGSRRPAHVAFVGAGPGDAGLLTVRAVEYLGRADAVVVDPGAGEGPLTRHVRPEATIIETGPGEHGQRLTHAAHAKILVRAAKSHPGGLVVRLMDGDPAFFHGLAEEANACVKAEVPFEIVPGVSAVHAVPAYAGIPLTSATSTSVQILGPTSTTSDMKASAAASVTVVALGGPPTLSRIAGELIAAGRPGETPVALTHRGTTTQQSTIVTTLAHVAQEVAESTGPCLLVVGPTVGLRESLSWFETKPLFGWDVLVPRTKEESVSMIARLEGYGARSRVVPTISVEPPRTPQQMERAITGLVTGRYAWIGFTSVNAVRAVRERLEALGLDARSFAGVKIAAVTGSTWQALKDWGIVADLVPEHDQTARGMLEAWPEHDPDLDGLDRVFLPRADISTDTLVAGLGELGWEVDDVTAFRSVRAAPPAQPIRDSIKSGGFDAVVFTSASTVRNLVGIAGKPHPNTVIACIGPQTAKAAEDHGLRVDVLAGEPSLEGVVDALAGHGRALSHAASEAQEPVVRPSQRRVTTRRRAR